MVINICSAVVNQHQTYNINTETVTKLFSRKPTPLMFSTTNSHAPQYQIIPMFIQPIINGNMENREIRLPPRQFIILRFSELELYISLIIALHLVSLASTYVSYLRISIITENIVREIRIQTESYTVLYILWVANSPGKRIVKKIIPKYQYTLKF